jgi:predicted nucleic acid-binding protein
LYRKRIKLAPELVSRTLDHIFETGIAINPELSTIKMDDESDRVFYDTAVTAGAILITGNLKDFPPKEFVMSPADFLKMLDEE